ncbi:MAG: hypothetical protein KGZ60_10060 [Truepera sp.]|nr:hypothetical protein [Truepera sp.]
MQILDEQQVAGLSWQRVLGTLTEAFVLKAERPDAYLMPERTVLSGPGGAIYLSMPCADAEGWFGVKQVAVVPNNAAKSRPTVQAWYTLFDPAGTPVLAMSATILTRLRTAAVSAIAARHLALPDANTLLVVGTGSLAPWMAEAHAQVRNYARLLVWGRDGGKAERTAETLRERLPGISVEVEEDRAHALLAADVVTVATTARDPILYGAWLREGQHLDLVGAFTPELAEVDGDAVKRAVVFVDDLAAAKAEAGDLIQAAARNWSWQTVRGELADVVTGRAGRRSADEITLFKSVGLGLEDLAVSRLLL